MKIVSRSEWKARPAKPGSRRKIPLPTPRLWLHHTAGALDAGGNGVWWDDVRGIQNFHLDGRGWNDIAYSFVVGGGMVFEGRGAGVAGGHTAGDNSTSHAICLIGDYTWMEPTDADIQAIVGRALEVVLGGADLDAKTAEYWGWLNRAFAPGEARPHVEDLARRIASVPPDVIALSKRCVDAALGPVEPGLLLEAQLFHVLAMSPEGRRRMQAFVEAGGQTRDAELSGGTNFSSVR